MTAAHGNLLRHLDSMRCVCCSGQLAHRHNALICAACGNEFPLLDGIPILVDDRDRAPQASAGHMETLFRFPSFYQFKIDLLRILNKTNDLNITEFLQDKNVVDVGCGPSPYGYDVRIPRSIVGLDLSPQFVKTRSEHDRDNLYIVASAKKIPFAANTFDTALLRFVIHHIPGDTAQLLREVARVTREHLIIFDHVRSDVPWKRTVQTTYWTLFDSGHHYNTLGEWDELLRPYRVLAFRRTGRMFGNVCQIILDLRD